MTWILALIAIGLLVRCADLKGDRDYWEARARECEDAQVIALVDKP